jgi:hypothetical protein
MRTKRFLGALAVLVAGFAAASTVGVVGLWPGAPSAVPSAPGRDETCTVGQFVAAQGLPEIDPMLGHLRDRLDQPPFTAFDRFEFLVSHEFPCELDRVSLPLHGGGEVTLERAGSSGHDRAWAIEAHDGAGHTVMRARAVVHPNRPLLIVTGSSDPESVVIWIESA